MEFDIDPETMELPVPPLMLQTLVENAIKHGISKEVKGGHILIGSQVRNMQHEITIRNTGQIVENQNGNGFRPCQHPAAPWPALRKRLPSISITWTMQRWKQKCRCRCYNVN